MPVSGTAVDYARTEQARFREHLPVPLRLRHFRRAPAISLPVTVVVPFPGGDSMPTSTRTTT